MSSTDVQTFLLIHLVAKIGFQANDAVSSLKLIEKGFSKEDLALTVLIDFPFQIILGYFAARWSRGDNALRPWLVGYVARLIFAVIAMGIVAGLPSSSGSSGGVGYAYFALIIVTTVAGSFASTVQFVGISAFHTQIADPLIGGTYMTLLNTVSNLGGTWPSYFVLKAVDWFTFSECRVNPSTIAEKAGNKLKAGLAGEKAAEAAQNLLDSLSGDPAAGAGFITSPAGAGCATIDSAKQACRAVGGQCVTTQDGYYITSTACVVIGLVVLVTFILPKSRQLQKKSIQEWRLPKEEASVIGEKKKE